MVWNNRGSSLFCTYCVSRVHGLYTFPWKLIFILTSFGITPEYPTHPTFLGLRLGLRLALGLGLGLGLALGLGLGLGLEIRVRD